MLTTSENHDDHHDDTLPEDDGVPLHHVTIGDGPALIAAFREAVHAADIARDAFYAHGIGPDRVTVAASLTDDGQPFVLITATQPGADKSNTYPRDSGRRCDVDADPPRHTQGLLHLVRRTDPGSLGGRGRPRGPPTDATTRADRAV